MAIIVLQSPPTKGDLKKAREEHSDYIKITVDLRQKLVAVGGEFHADAEKILLEDYGSKQEDIWGGGYDIENANFTTDAIINIRHNPENHSTEIINEEIRQSFFKLVKEKLAEVKSLI